MKTIFIIAKTELRQLFSSPIAWLILAIFSIQSGLYFTQLFNDQVMIKEVGDSLLPQTARIYTSFFRKMQEYLFLYIPLLTMGLLSLERRNGTIKLLFSSPITNTQIVCGKYLSMMIYNLIIAVILFLPVVFGAVYIPHLDFGLVLSAILGLYLLACAYSAVGLFMSGLTSYQIFAGLATLTLLSLLTMAGKMWQSIPVLKDIAYWICISGRANKMVAGLICSEDVLYFAFISLFFILLTICKLNVERDRKSLKRKSLEYVCIVALVFALGYVSSRSIFKFYADCTASRSNTLAVPSIDAVNSIDGDITVTTFVNILDKDSSIGLPDQSVVDRNRFDMYSRFNKGMKFKYVYYYGPNVNPSLEQLYPGTTDQEKMQKICESLGLKEKMFKTLAEVESGYGVDLSKEGYKFVRRLSTRDGHTSWLRIFNDFAKHPREEEISAAVRQLSVGPCKLGYVTGHGERSIMKSGDRDLFVNVLDITYRKSLVNNGFDPVEVDAAEGIPSDIDVLVIADPKLPFSEKEQTVMKDYLARGGNALICTESGHQHFVNPVTDAIGVHFESGCLLQEGDDFEPELVMALPDSSSLHLWGRLRWMRRWGYCIPMNNAVEYRISTANGFETVNLFTSAPSGVRNEHTGVERSYPLVSQMVRNVGEKEQHIIVCSGTDWLSNSEGTRQRNGLHQNNAIPYTYIYSFLSRGYYPCNTDHPLELDREMNAGQTTSVTANILFMAIIPLLMVILCVIIRTIRSRR